MKLSEHFKLGATQYELDFVDIDPSTDCPLFLDPYFLSLRHDQFSVDSSRTIKNFFSKLLQLLKEKKSRDAEELFSHLDEPNETCLGLSRGKPQGHGIGPTDARKIFQSLSKSRAVASGLIEDLEDCRIFIPNVDKDKISDMTTNILRHHLNDYTIAQCKLWSLPLTENVPQGFVWDRERMLWVADYSPALLVNGKRILLVPRAITSFAKKYTPQRYHQHFVLNFLQHEHIRLNTALVQLSKDKKPFVTKKSLSEGEAAYSKEFLIEFTEKHPEVFQDFRKQEAANLKSASNEELSVVDKATVCDHLIKQLRSIPSGTDNATAFHHTCVGILELLFYPSLICPQLERPLHDGRKRIDITFDNAAEAGFFQQLAVHEKIPCRYVMIECKNYTGDPKNPELDQLAGRFGVNRGMFGLLVCRTIKEKSLFNARCADTFKDQRGLILPLTDEDLIEALSTVKTNAGRTIEDILRAIQREIAFK